MILDQRPGEPMGVALDRAVDGGRLSAHDAEQIETFSEFLTYAGKPGQANEAQARWLAAFCRTARGGQMVLGTEDRAVHADYADRLERTAWKRRTR